MADTAPTTTNGGSMDTLKGNAQAAYNQLANGPAAQTAKDQANKASSEFSTLANSRQTPANPAATGQPLTHYHSFFFELLSWNNPRASGIAYASIVTLIFAARYLDVLRYSLKLTWMTLAVTVLAEAVGKLAFSNGLTSQLRPRKYYTIPKETLDAMIGDVHELINFFVIEAQRILFAENVPASIAVCLGSLLSYYLVKIVPYWGLALIATTVTFFAPLIYTSNQELIDSTVKQASDVMSSQTEQIRSVASKHTNQATAITQQYLGDYTAKAQEMISGRSTSPAATSKPAPASTLNDSDFPQAPKQDFTAPEPSIAKTEEEEPLIAA